MQTANEIRGYLTNIRYYIGEVKKCVDKQMNMDFQLEMVAQDPATARFECLGAIAAGCSWIESYCQGIEINLKAGEATDKPMIAKEEVIM